MISLAIYQLVNVYCILEGVGLVYVKNIGVCLTFFLVIKLIQNVSVIYLRFNVHASGP